MATQNYKITITEHDYAYTRYIAWVQGTSRNQALVKAAALAGQEKARREHERMPQHGVAVEGLLEPEVTVEPCDLDEYWNKRNTVEVST